MADYPLPAFHFSVCIGLNLAETSFRDVEGIGTGLETEAFESGGENRYQQMLPTKVRQSELVVKRGVAAMTSPLVLWCKASLEAGLSVRITTMPISVSLLDENRAPVRNWHFANAYPVDWSVDAFSSMNNEVAIEQVKFAYTYQKRML